MTESASWRWALVPVVAALITFANTLPGDFVYDDVVLIERDADLKELNLQRIFGQNYWGAERVDRNYRPLTLLSYALNYQVSEEPWAFHLVNVVLNALVAWLAYRVLLELTGDPAVSALSAALYAVLPIHSEAVANIVGRAELLAAAALLGAWLTALRSRPGRPGGPILAAAITLAGMACKEHVITVTAVIVLGALATGRRVPWLAAAATMAGILAYLLARKLVLGATSEFIAGTDNPLIETDGVTRALNGVALLGKYVVKTIAPVHLSASYTFNQIPVRPLSDAWLWAAAAAWAGAATAAIWLWRRGERLAAWAPLFFLITFATTSNVLVPIGTNFAERLAYLPSFALAIFSGGLLASPRLARWRTANMVALAILTAVFAARSVVRNRDWADRNTMYLRMPLDAPNSAASHLKAADAYVEMSKDAAGDVRAGLLAKAESAARNAIAISPASGKADAKLAEIHYLAGRHDEALRAFDRALPMLQQSRQIEPVIFYLRGRCLLALNRLEEARAAFDDFLTVRERLGARPHPVGLNFRGLATALLGRFREALADFDRALELEQALPELWNNRGMCKLSLGDIRGAIEDWQRGLELCRRTGVNFAPGKESAHSFLVKLAGAHEALAAAADATDTERARAERSEALRLRQEAAALVPRPR